MSCESLDHFFVDGIFLETLVILFMLITIIGTLILI